MPPASLASRVVRGWLHLLTALLGVNIKIYGKPLTGRTLFVANHISWLDIPVIGSLIPVHFLSKYEVKTMPVIGWLATRAGTLYIKRGNKHSACDATAEIARILKRNQNSLIFAEGTTTDGNIRKFHSRTLQSAIDTQAMVQPVAIFYPVSNPLTRKKQLNPATLFTGDTTIGESTDRIMRSPSIDVSVHFLAPIQAIDQTRDELALHAFEEVVNAIKNMQA